jgi:hypothetical protein
MAPWVGCKAFCLVPSQTPGIWFLLRHMNHRAPGVWREVQDPSTPSDTVIVTCKLNKMENLFLNKKSLGHQEPYYEQGMAPIVLTIRAREAMEYYEVTEVYIMGGVHTHPSSVSHIPSDSQTNKEADIDNLLQIVSHLSILLPSPLCMSLHSTSQYRPRLQKP